MFAAPGSVLSRTVRDGDKAFGTTIQVPIEAGHAWAGRNGVFPISLLKIDTEGADLDVLVGFEPLLAHVDAVQVEASMNPHNRAHVPFRDIEDFLRARGFLLFRFYDQTFEWKKGGRPVLRRADAAFINARLVSLDGID